MNRSDADSLALRLREIQNGNDIPFDKNDHTRTVEETSPCRTFIPFVSI